MNDLERWLFVSVLATFVAIALLLSGCAPAVHPPMVCQAAEAAGSQFLVCTPIDTKQIRRGGGDV